MCISLTVVHWWWCLNALTTTVCAWTALRPTAPQSWRIDNLWRMTGWGSPFRAQVRDDEPSASHVHTHVHTHTHITHARTHIHAQHTYIHTYIHMYVHAQWNTQLCTYSRTFCWPVLPTAFSSKSPHPSQSTCQLAISCVLGALVGLNWLYIASPLPGTDDWLGQYHDRFRCPDCKGCSNVGDIPKLHWISTKHYFSSIMVNSGTW